MDKHLSSITPGEISALIKRCINGDDTSQAEFYNIYFELITKAVIHTMTKYQSIDLQNSDAQEMSHDIFLHITQNNYAALQCLHSPSSINAWLIRVSHNYVVSQLRKENTRKKAYQNAVLETSPYGVATPEDNAINKERLQILERSLKTLSPKEQLMLNLYYIQNRKYSDIAEILNISINTVASRLHRAKTKLRDSLKDHS